MNRNKRSLSAGFTVQIDRNTHQLTNSSGAVVDSYIYSAYGLGLSHTGTDDNPFQYGGQAGYYTDGPTGIMLCGARWYDPYIGRWLSRDPVEYAGGANLYQYCAANPLCFIDPSGTDMEAIRNWYMGGMGGFSNWVDDNLMFGTTANFGDTAGRYDAGCASAGEVLWSGAKFSGMLAYNGFSLGKMAVSGGRLLIGGGGKAALANGIKAATVRGGIGPVLKGRAGVASDSRAWPCNRFKPTNAMPPPSGAGRPKNVKNGNGSGSQA